MTGAIALRRYQQDAVDAIDAGLQRGVTRPLLVIATGGGKTVVFATVIVRRGGTAIVIAHRDELLDQAAEKLVAVDPTLGLSIGFVAGKANEWGAPIVIASAQTLSQPRRLRQLPRSFTTGVVDEGHHAAADGYVKILNHLADVPLIIGATATPTRSDSRSLASVWDEVVFRRSILDLIRDGWLSNVRGVRVTVNARLDDIRQSAGDFDADELGEALTDASAPAHVLAAYLKHATGRPTLQFVPTVALAHTMAAVFREAGVTAEAVDGTTDPVERSRIVRRLETGETKVLSNVGVFTEGFDSPCVSCVIMATPTKSEIKYTQCVGRGTRLDDGKDDLVVIDVVGVTERMSLQTYATLFGLDEMPAADVTVTEALDAQATRRRAPQRSRGDLVSRPVDLLAADDPAAMHWLRHREVLLLSAGRAGVIALTPAAGERWTVVHLGRNANETVAADVELGSAQEIAWDYVRHLGAEQFSDPAAAWRRARMTSAQRAVLRRLEQPYPPTATRGDASDLIAIAQSARALARPADTPAADRRPQPVRSP